MFAKLKDRVKRAYAYSEKFVMSFLGSISNPSVETRQGTDGSQQARVHFDSKLGPVTTPWVSVEEAERIAKKVL